MSRTRPHLEYRKGRWVLILSSFGRTPTFYIEAASRWCGDRNVER